MVTNTVSLPVESLETIVPDGVLETLFALEVAPGFGIERELETLDALEKSAVAKLSDANPVEGFVTERLAQDVVCSLELEGFRHSLLAKVLDLLLQLRDRETRLQYSTEVHDSLFERHSKEAILEDGLELLGIASDGAEAEAVCVEVSDYLDGTLYRLGEIAPMLHLEM